MLALALLGAESVGPPSGNGGGHVTPEQWARHAFLAGLGFTDHHSLAVTTDSDRDVAVADIRSAIGFASAPISTGGVLPVEDRWHTVNYIRTFGNSAADDQDARRLIAGPSGPPMSDQKAISTEVIEMPPVSQRMRTSAMTPRPPNDDGFADSSPLLAKMVSTTPDGPWRVIGRWQSSGPATTEHFTVTSPWRIRWRIDADDEPFVAVLEPGPNGPILLEAADGIVQGAFHVGPAGTFFLAVRTQVPWELVVEDLSTEDRGASQ